MAAANAPTYTEVAKRVDESMAELDEEDKALAALEADLRAAESRVEAAELRYAIVARQIERDLAKGMDETPKGPRGAVLGEGRNEPSQGVPDDVPEHTKKASTTAKNTGAKSSKEVSREKWLAKRAAESRVSHAAQKARERLRGKARGKRMFYEESMEAAGEQSPGAPAAAAQPSAPEARRPRDPLFESSEVLEGAKSLAARLQSLKDRPTSDADKQCSLVKILSGGRENYYTLAPIDVLNDLKNRGLVGADVAGQYLDLLKKGSDGKGAGIPPDQWLAHAQKVSSMAREEDAPYKDSEQLYLKWAEKESLVAAEEELNAAEAQLQDLLQQAEANYPLDQWKEEAQKNGGGDFDVQVDMDYAARLEDQYDHEKGSRGAKNTSALSGKVVSAEKWEQARNKEEREKENNTIARESRRQEARDLKSDGASAPGA